MDENTVTVRIVQACGLWAVGEVVEVSARQAQKLVATGYAVEPGQKVETTMRETFETAMKPRARGRR